MRTILSSLLAFAFSFSTQAHDHNPQNGHLEFEGGTLHAHVSWDQGPNLRKESIMKIEWKNGLDHKPKAPPRAFTVEPWMTDPKHDHGTRPVKIEQINPSTFKVSKVFLTMAGPWEIRVTLAPINGIEERKTFTVNVGGGDHGGHKH